MTDLQAALGLSQLEQLDDIVAERNDQFQHYQKLDDLPVRLLEVPECAQLSASSCYPLNKTTADKHKQVFKGLRAAGIGVQLHYTPVHLQPYYRRLGFHESDFPEAEAYACNAISLPIYPGLQNSDQRRVVRTLAALLAA